MPQRGQYAVTWKSLYSRSGHAGASGPTTRSGRTRDPSSSTRPPCRSRTPFARERASSPRHSAGPRSPGTDERTPRCRDASMSRFDPGPDRLLHLDFNGEAVAVPPGLAMDVVAGHGAVARVQVLEGPGLDVADVRPVVRRGRPVEEDPLRTDRPRVAQAPGEDVVPGAKTPASPAPSWADPTFGSTGRYLAIALLPLHRGLPNEERLVPFRDEALAPRYHPAWPNPSRGPPPHRLPSGWSGRPEPPAVTGGPVRVYWATAEAPFGRRLGEDVRRGRTTGLPPSPARCRPTFRLLVPVVAFRQIVPVGRRLLGRDRDGKHLQLRRKPLASPHVRHAGQHAKPGCHQLDGGLEGHHQAGRDRERQHRLLDGGEQQQDSTCRCGQNTTARGMGRSRGVGTVVRRLG